MKRSVLALTVAATLALAGCGSEDAGGPSKGGDDGITAITASNPTIGASETAQWDNGLSATITAATAKPQDNAGHKIVITIEIANDGDETFIFDDPYMGPNGPRDRLFYGENLHEAEKLASDKDLPELPRQLVPGSSASYAATWGVPSEELAALTLALTPDNRNLATYLFTDVQALLNVDGDLEGGAAALDAEAQANASENEFAVVGEEYTAYDWDGEPYYTFTVNSITIDGQCGGGSPPEPDNGHFLVLDVTATNIHAGGDPVSGYDMGLNVFSVDGMMENEPNTLAAAMCEGDMSIPSSVPAGKSVNFIAVGDTQFTSGVVIFADVTFQF